MKRKLWIHGGLVLGIVFFLAGTALAQASGDGKVTMEKWNALIQDKVAELSPDGKGVVNYEEGYIEAVGIGAPPEKYMGKPQGRPMALRAAQVDAYRNLLEITKGVQIDSETKVQDFTVESDRITAQVSGLVKNAQVVDRQYLSDGTVEVTLRMRLGTDFNKIILPKATADDKKTDAKPPKVKTRSTPKGEEVFTGLIVDARGLGAKPAMSPKVFDEDGKEVYGTLVVSKDFAIQQGIAGYARDTEKAKTNPRVTDNPLTVKAQSAEGAGKSDLKIGNDDAKTLRTVKENQAFLQKCRVMIVLD